MTFCYNQTLKGYFYQCWKCIYISWMIIGTCNLYAKSKFHEIVNVINKCLGQPLSVKCDLCNGLNNERYRQFKSNYHGRNKFLALSISSYSPDWYCANTFHLSSKYNHKKRSLFHELFLTLLTHQNHFVEFYLTMAKTALQIFQVKTCVLGVTYNVNVRHSISLILNTVVSHAVSSVFFSPLGQLLKIFSKQISLIHMYTYFW